MFYKEEPEETKECAHCGVPCKKTYCSTQCKFYDLE